MEGAGGLALSKISDFFLSPSPPCAFLRDAFYRRVLVCFVFFFFGFCFLHICDFHLALYGCFLRGLSPFRGVVHVFFECSHLWFIVCRHGHICVGFALLLALHFRYLAPFLHSFMGSVGEFTVLIWVGIYWDSVWGVGDLL